MIHDNRSASCGRLLAIARCLATVGLATFAVPAVAVPPEGADTSPTPVASPAPVVAADDVQTSELPVARRDTSGHDVDYWVEQLGSDHYLRRASAQQKLIAAGNDAVPALERSLVNGDLETTELAIRALGEIAMQQAPDDASGAWSVLQRLSLESAGSKANRAKLVFEEINDHRSEQARTMLVAAGVFVGIDDFVVQAISGTQLIVQIDEGWRGDVSSLDWLRWLKDIQYARVSGAAVNPEVISRLVQMPDLKTIALVDATVDEATLRPLGSMRSIQALELHYIKLTEPLADLIATLPLRASLSLMGTDLTTEKVESMREALPGLKIEYKKGGFLGVMCSDGFNPCQINSVVAGSAAAKAGLQMGDVIVRIEDAEVTRFRDLQAKINEHYAGDALRVEYLRGDQKLETQVVLGKLRDR